MFKANSQEKLAGEKRKKPEVAPNQKPAKRIRYKENEVYMEEQSQPYVGDSFHARRVSISSTSPVCSPILASINNSFPEEDELVLGEVAEPSYTPSEAMFRTAFERAFEALSVGGIAEFTDDIQTDDIHVTRPRAGAFFHKPVAVRFPLAEVQLPVVEPSHDMDVGSDAPVRVGRSRSSSNPF